MEGVAQLSRNHYLLTDNKYFSPPSPLFRNLVKQTSWPGHSIKKRTAAKSETLESNLFENGQNSDCTRGTHLLETSYTMFFF